MSAHLAGFLPGAEISSSLVNQPAPSSRVTLGARSRGAYVSRGAVSYLGQPPGKNCLQRPGEMVLLRGVRLFCTGQQVTPKAHTAARSGGR